MSTSGAPAKIEFSGEVKDVLDKMGRVEMSVSRVEAKLKQLGNSGDRAKEKAKSAGDSMVGGFTAAAGAATAALAVFATINQTLDEIIRKQGEVNRAGRGTAGSVLASAQSSPLAGISAADRSVVLREARAMSTQVPMTPEAAVKAIATASNNNPQGSVNQWIKDARQGAMLANNLGANDPTNAVAQRSTLTKLGISGGKSDNLLAFGAQHGLDLAGTEFQAMVNSGADPLQSAAVMAGMKESGLDPEGLKTIAKGIRDEGLAGGRDPVAAAVAMMAGGDSRIAKIAGKRNPENAVAVRRMMNSGAVQRYAKEIGGASAGVDATRGGLGAISDLLDTQDKMDAQVNAAQWEGMKSANSRFGRLVDADTAAATAYRTAHPVKGAIADTLISASRMASPGTYATDLALGQTPMMALAGSGPVSAPPPPPPPVRVSAPPGYSVNVNVRVAPERSTASAL